MTGNPHFPPLLINGQIVEFGHLQPFTMQFDSKSANKRLRVNVRYSNHCFSFKPTPGVQYDPELLLLDHSKRERVFCPVRYNLSLDLPSIVKSLNDPSCKVWETSSRRNYTYSVRVDNPKGPYHLFFELSKDSSGRGTLQDLNMFIESAYHEDPQKGPPAVIGRIGFHVLCTNVYLRKKVSTKR